MSKKTKMFKKFSLVISYVAVFASQASFATDEKQPVPQVPPQIEVIDAQASPENDVIPVDIVIEPEKIDPLAESTPSVENSATKDVKENVDDSVSNPDDVPDNDPVPESDILIDDVEDFKQILINADKPVLTDETTDPVANKDNVANPQDVDGASPENNNLGAETSDVADPYTELRGHLSDFLLSFAGEEQLSKSNPHVKNLDSELVAGVDATETNATIGEVTIEDKTPAEASVSPDKIDSGATTNSDTTPATSSVSPDNVVVTEANQIENKSLEETKTQSSAAETKPEEGIADTTLSENKSLDEIFDDKIDIEEEQEVDKKTLAEQKLKEEKKKIIMGSCNDLPEKIAICEDFSCEMPNPADGKDKVKILLEKDGDICNYTSINSQKSEFNCMLNDSEISILSELTKNYFTASSGKNLNVESEFPTQCKPTNLAVSTEEESVEEAKPTKLELDDEDAAYFEALDKEKKSLPEEKQLPDSVSKTIKDIAPSLTDKKKPSAKKEKSDKYKISHGKKAKKPSDDDGVKKSENGMDISMSISSSEQSEIRSLIDKAYRALVSGQTSAAISLYNNVLEIDDKNMDALFGLATAYHRNYQYEQARAIYAQILTINPNNKEVLNNFLVLVAEESPESALIELQKLERINSSFSPIPAQIAMIYLKMGQTEKAERYLRRAITLSPENVTYKYNLAIASDKLNKHAQAISLYRQVLDAARAGISIPGSANSIQERMNYLEGKLSSTN